MSETDQGFLVALEEAKKGSVEGGVPIGACLVSRDGKILGRGHNMRVQKGSATLHVSSSTIRPTPTHLITSVPYSLQPQAEIAALENSGRLPAKAYEGATMYTSLSPCDMCTGACILYKVARVVIGENKTFLGGEKYLKERGVEVVVFKNQECKGLMEKFIHEKPDVWYVDSSGHERPK